MYDDSGYGGIDSRENHLLREIDQMVSFDFIYDFAALYYPANGRSSVELVSMFKMLLVGYGQV